MKKYKISKDTVPVPVSVKVKGTVHIFSCITNTLLLMSVQTKNIVNIQYNTYRLVLGSTGCHPRPDPGSPNPRSLARPQCPPHPRVQQDLRSPRMERQNKGTGTGR
jgi:hypothetical protein